MLRTELILNSYRFLSLQLQQYFSFSMIQAETWPYRQLLLQFYQTVAHKHPKASENQSQLQNILNSDQASIKQQHSKHYVKKASRDTNYSFASGCESQQPSGQDSWENDSLQFTFFQVQKRNSNQFCKQIINFKYHSSCIFKVVLYSLCFSHLHLQTVVQSRRKGIAHLISQNQTIVESLLSVLQGRVKRQSGKDGSRQSCSLQLLAHFMLKVSAGVETLVNHLKILVDGLEDEVVRQVCIATAHRIRNQADQRKPQYAAVQTDICEGATQNQQDDSDVLDLMAAQLKLRVKLQDDKQSVRWGRKDSPICIGIVQSPFSFQFSLKQIIYYQEGHGKTKHSRQSLEQSYHLAQLVEI